MISNATMVSAPGLRGFRIKLVCAASAAIVFLGALTGCVGTRQFVLVDFLDEDPPPDSTLAYSVFLIGDAGAPRVDQMEPTLKLLQSRLQEAGEYSAVIFLGDNIYPSGMPSEGDPWRSEAERRINAQLDAVAEYEGRVFFVPGNHDWGGEGLGGNRAALARQEDYIEAYLDRGNTFVPDNGFPGPVELRVNDWLTIVALDTQWWLEPDKTYGDTGTYILDQEATVLVELHDVLERNRNRDVLVAGHHPMFSNGSHGGRASGKSLLYTVTRQYLGTPQDLSNFYYRQMRDRLLSVFERKKGLVYAAGHDHNLQYFRYGEQHFIVSGSGTKLSYVQEEGGGVSFAATEQGFSVVDYFADGSTWLSFWAPEGDGPTGRMLYRTRLKEPGTEPLPQRVVPSRQPQQQIADLAPDSLTGTPLEPTEATADSLLAKAEPSPDPEQRLEPLEEDEEPYEFHTTGTVTLAPGPDYRVGPIKRFFLGERYRDLWAMPVEIPVIDLSRTAGGLTPIQRGGGLQTISLRMLGGDGDQYVLRSVNKDPTPSIPPYLRRTIAHDIVQDQISAIHPYAAFVLPPMLDAAGVYHTEPQLVYIPDDPRLGIYRDEFAGLIAMIEMRPDEEQTDEARFGRPENIIGSAKLFEEIEEDNDERVDERAFARARLVDMWIGDWDRHKDQWRWSEFDVTPGKIYKPVPRDRDFAFFKFDGFLPRLTRIFGPLAARRLTNFERGYHDVLGLNYNGAAMDRRFTSSLTEQDWVDIADSLRASLTDSVIIAGLERWPKPVFDRYADRTLRLLQERREELPDVASEYYGHLAEIVDFVGSDKHERFEVTRLDDEHIEVVMYKTKKEGDIDRELMRRTLSDRETSEVRLYGLGGFDQFIVSGTGRSSIRVRAIGGSEQDVFVDDTGRGRTYFYDTDIGNEFQTSPGTTVIASPDPSVNNYDMLRFEVDALTFIPFFELNADDRVLLGGGVAWTKQGFRKHPFASRHALRANYAFRTGAYNIVYDGLIKEFWNAWDLRTEVSLLTPHEFDNFFGFGNFTPNDDATRNLFSSRLSNLTVNPELNKEIVPFLNARIGPHFRYWNIEHPDNRIEPVDGVGLPEEEFTDTYFVGATGALTVMGTDTLAANRAGFFWDLQAEGNVGVRHANEIFLRLTSDLRYYYTFTRWPWLTLAFRFGGATNIGDYRFYQANTLGNRENLRGYVRTRFSGRSSLYSNFDARVRLGDLNIYLARGDFGVFGFVDNGRVWGGDDPTTITSFVDLTEWHQGFGGGFWFSPLHRLVFTTGIEYSHENLLFDFSLDFFF